MIPRIVLTVSLSIVVVISSMELASANPDFKDDDIFERIAANLSEIPGFNITMNVREQTDVDHKLSNLLPSRGSIIYWVTSSISKYMFRHYGVPIIKRYFEGKQRQVDGSDAQRVSRDGWGNSHYVNLHEPGGIAFPSLEGALLSLAFLTFAVFLVDLVQQVISRLKTGTAVPLLGRRRKRNVQSMEKSILYDNPVFSTLSSNIITAIESPLFADMNE